MKEKQELYHDEINNLRKFRAKIDNHAIYKEDLDHFSNEYEQMIAQAKVITKVSDRLQKKLDHANIQIRNQNDVIKWKNIRLKNTVIQLAHARVGKKASTIMLFVALIFFITEQFFLEPIIEQTIPIPYLNLIILLFLFLIIKIMESSLEKYFMTKEKKRILKQENKEKTN